MADNTLEFTESDLAQMQRFNRKLAWLPRFRVRNRLTPRLIQTLLRASQMLGANKPVKHGLQVQSTVVHSHAASVPVRIIRPQGKPKGVVLDYHGGGWVIGNAQMNDDLNIAMVKACNVAVVSVDYRLAVNTPVEALMADCLCAARWLLSDDCTEFVGLPVIIVGESAGAHLAPQRYWHSNQHPACCSASAAPCCITASTISRAPRAYTPHLQKRWYSTARAWLRRCAC